MTREHRHRRLLLFLLLLFLSEDVVVDELFDLLPLAVHRVARLQLRGSGALHPRPPLPRHPRLLLHEQPRQREARVRCGRVERRRGDVARECARHGRVGTVGVPRRRRRRRLGAARRGVSAVRRAAPPDGGGRHAHVVQLVHPRLAGVQRGERRTAGDVALVDERILHLHPQLLEVVAPLELWLEVKVGGGGGGRVGEDERSALRRGQVRLVEEHRSGAQRRAQLQAELRAERVGNHRQAAAAVHVPPRRLTTLSTGGATCCRQRRLKHRERRAPMKPADTTRNKIQFFFSR